MLITLASHQAAHPIQSGNDDLQGPGTPAAIVPLPTCFRLQIIVNNAVVREEPAGPVQNQDIDHIMCIQLSGTTCLEQPATTRVFCDIHRDISKSCQDIPIGHRLQ